MQSTTADSFHVTTLLGSHTGLSALLPVDFALQSDLTLNSHYGVLASTPPASVPKLRYYGVGIRGCYNADDTMLTSAYNPSRLNMDMYTPIPIRCVPVDEDLSDAERANYRLRVRKTLSNGEDYYLYYLKVLEFADGIKCKQTITATGEEVAYDFDPQYLDPTPTKMDANETVDSSTASIVTYVEANISITADEILEYISIEYGDTRYAKISELGLFTGDEQEVSSTDSSGLAMTYMEAVYVMMYSHLTWTGTPLTHSGMSFTGTFQITNQGSISNS